MTAETEESKGSQGRRGEPGEKGRPGPRGATGIDGPAGSLSLPDVLAALNETISDFGALVGQERESRRDHINKVLEAERRSRRRGVVVVAAVMFAIASTGVWTVRERDLACIRGNDTRFQIRQVAVSAVDSVLDFSDIPQSQRAEILSRVAARAAGDLPPREC